MPRANRKFLCDAMTLQEMFFCSHVSSPTCQSSFDVCPVAGNVRKIYWEKVGMREEQDLPTEQLDHFFSRSSPLNLGLASRNVTARSLKLVPSNDLMLLAPATIHVLLKLKSALWVMCPRVSPDTLDSSAMPPADWTFSADSRKLMPPLSTLGGRSHGAMSTTSAAPMFLMFNTGMFTLGRCQQRSLRRPAGWEWHEPVSVPYAPRPLNIVSALVTNGRYRVGVGVSVRLHQHRVVVVEVVL